MVARPALFVSERESSRAAPAGSDSRQKLLDAAQQVFAEVGFYDATVRQICKRAGVSVALVNYRFGDKLQLYVEILRRALPRGIGPDILKAADPEVDPLSLLRDLVSALLPDSNNLTTWEILMHHERRRPTPALEFIVDHAIRPAYQTLCIVIGRILSLPAAHDTTRLITHSVIAQTRYFAEPTVLSRLDPAISAGKTNAELANAIIDVSLAGFLARGHTP